MIHEYDVAVIGGGIAGLYTALTASENAKVAVISKVHVTRSHSVAVGYVEDVGHLLVAPIFNII